MQFKDVGGAIAAFAVTTVPALAQATVERAAAPLEDANNMGGGSSLLIIALVVALGIGIYFITKNDNNKPDSP